MAIWRIERKAGLVVPVLADLLASKEYHVSGRAAEDIGKIGPEAKAAVPAPGRASEREVCAVTGVAPSITIKE